MKERYAAETNVRIWSKPNHLLRRASTEGMTNKAVNRSPKIGTYARFLEMLEERVAR